MPNLLDEPHENLATILNNALTILLHRGLPEVLMVHSGQILTTDDDIPF